MDSDQLPQFLKRREFLKTSSLAAGAIALASCKSTSTHPVILNSGRFDALQPMNEGLPTILEQDYEERRDRLRKELKQASASALLLAGGHSLFYFTGLSWGISDRFWGVILLQTGECVAIVPAFERTRAEETLPKNFELRLWQENEEALEIVWETLRKKIPANPSYLLAIDTEIPFRYVERLSQGWRNAAWTSGFEIVRRCRMKKTAKEIAIMRRANEITKRAIAEATKYLTEGSSEADFSNWVGEAHRKLGATHPWAITLFGPNAAYPHGTKEKRSLREGDFVLCDTGASLMGYQSDVTRSWVFGKPSERQCKIWETVKAAQDAAFRAVRPGASCAEIDAAARAVIESAGFGKGFEHFHHRLGHGIGLEGHEEPYLVPGNSLQLETGMTFSIEPGLYFYGEGGVRIEDIAVVTESGAEFLGERTPDLVKSGTFF